ncbi:hypothetical protein L3Q82_005506 [Scortum barcoo]|uniref:Uncharacterized protein n=1 Tax=Scortum barcoo TaxID=214431 RepID=A0ACB8VAN0_9TELE|nr:hypothetical protein L3Q82_005506 [Scortum barcoo]
MIECVLTTRRDSSCACVGGISAGRSSASMKSVAVGSISAIVLVIIFLHIAFLCIGKKRSAQQTTESGERPDNNAQLNMCSVCNNPSAAVQRAPAEEPDDIYYASVSFCINQEDPIYSNIRPAQANRFKNEEEDEDEEGVQYAMVNIKSASASSEPQRKGLCKDDVLLHLIQGQDGWGVTYTSTEICALKGSTVEISCTYRYPSRINERDTKVEETIWFVRLQDEEPVDVRTDSEYSGRVEYHCDKNDCTLRIRDVRERDSAEYKFMFITNQPGGRFTGSPGVTLSVTGFLLLWYSCVSYNPLTLQPAVTADVLNLSQFRKKKTLSSTTEPNEAIETTIESMYFNNSSKFPFIPRDILLLNDHNITLVHVTPRNMPLLSQSNVSQEGNVLVEQADLCTLLTDHRGKDSVKTTSFFTPRRETRGAAMSLRAAASGLVVFLLSVSAEPKRDANERLLTRMEVMMEDMRSDILSRFEQIVSETVKREITAALGPLEAKVTSHDKTIADLERSANDYGDKLINLEATVATLTTLADSLSKKCEDLEGRSRLNNVRLVGIPEGTEGPRPTDFVATLLQDLLGLDNKPVLDRAQYPGSVDTDSAKVV